MQENLNASIDLNHRLDRGDGAALGSRSNTTQLITIVAVVASVLGVGIALFNATGRNNGVSVTAPATVQAH